MPTKKTTKATAKKSKDSEADNVPEDSNASSNQAKETIAMQKMGLEKERTKAIKNK